MDNKVYIVILNYNGWKDTIECVESVLKSNYSNFQLVIVDNQSSDDSLEWFEKWAQGDYIPEPTNNTQLLNLSFPFQNKPVEHVFYNKNEALEGGTEKEKDLNKPVIFVAADENKGFAAGNNIAIKYALAKNDFGFIWLLNNDTVIEKNSLEKLIEGIEKYNDVGAVGSKVLYYNQPQLIQSLGSKIDPRSIYKLNKPVINTSKKIMDSDQYEEDTEVNDIMGASLLIKKETIEHCGLIPTEYFLYREETDWNFGFQKKGFKLMTIPSSKVYHKEEQSSGGPGNPITQYYKTRNKFILYKKYKNQYIFNTKLYFFQFIIRSVITALFSKSEVKNAILEGLNDGINHVTGKRNHKFS